MSASHLIFNFLEGYQTFYKFTASQNWFNLFAHSNTVHTQRIQCYQDL